MASIDLGAWVRSVRLSAELTQEQLGEKLGVTKGNVSAWETGKHEPSVAQVQRIAEVTRRPPPWGGPMAPPSPGDFRDRREVSPSDWTLLQEVKDAMTAPHLARRIEDIREEARAIRALAEQIAQERIDNAKKGR